MAGDWIKMRVGLTNHPRVLRIAECLLEDGDFLSWSGLSFGVGGYPPPTPQEQRAERHTALRVTRYVTVTALLRFWGYANEHAKGEEIVGVWPEDVDEVTGVPGFAQAIEAAGWVNFDRERGGLTMPNFEEHNTSATERSSAGAERQKRYRERQKAAAGSDVTRDVTVTEREEKRREEKKDSSAGAETTKPAKRKAKLPEDFKPDATAERKASELGLSLSAELDAFRDHHTANGSVMLDWQAALRTWLTKAKKFQRVPPPSRADVARITVPGSTERDPTLVKLDEDAKNAAPLTPERRALLEAARRTLQ